MGGRGSGRHWHWDARDTTSDYRSIDVRRWAREGFLTPGCSFTTSWSLHGETVARISVRAEHGQVRLIYRSQYNGGEWQDYDYPVRLLSQQCHYGGHRQWFACPARGCGRRVAKLYSGRIFACRQCHNLAYPSTRESGYQRAQRRADRIEQRLGWASDPQLLYGTKPKGMHWRTFKRLMAEYDHWETRSNLGFARYFLGRWGHLADGL